MGAIADRVRQMRGCSLAQIVAEIEQMEAETRQIVMLPMQRANGFDHFWQAYPSKVGKADARKAFDKASKVVSFDVMMDGLARYAAKTDDRPWCNPGTWLRQERWADQPAAAPANLKGVSADRARLRQEIADGYERSGQTNSNSGNDRRLALGSGDHIEGVGRRLL